MWKTWFYEKITYYQSRLKQTSIIIYRVSSLVREYSHYHNYSLLVEGIFCFILSWWKSNECLEKWYNMEKDLPQRIVLMTSSVMDYTLVSIVPILLLLFVLKIRKWETEGSKLSKIFVKNFERWRKTETWWAKRNLSEFLLPSELLLLLVTKVREWTLGDLDSRLRGNDGT